MDMSYETSPEDASEVAARQADDVTPVVPPGAAIAQPVDGRLAAGISTQPVSGTTTRYTVSSAGATWGGLLVLVLGAGMILFAIIGRPLNDWRFGNLPGPIIIFAANALGLFPGFTCFIGAVWAGLGIAIIIMARQHLVAVCAFGLVAVGLLLVAPAVEWAIVIGPPPGGWNSLVWFVFWDAVTPLLIFLGLVFCLALARATGPAGRLKIAAIVALALASANNLIINIASASSTTFALINYLLASQLFIIGWLILIATATGEVAATNRPATSDQGNGFGTTALGLGLASAFFFIISYTALGKLPDTVAEALTALCLASGTAAIPLGATGIRAAGRGEATNKSAAAAGLVLGIIMTAFFLLSFGTLLGVSLF